MHHTKTQSRVIVLTIWIIVYAASTPAATLGSAPGAQLVAELHGSRISLRDVSKYHCHDRRSPVISCFATDDDRDRDLDLDGTDAAAYTSFFRDESYGGPSFTAHASLPALSAIGWDNHITSFKSLNGQRPRWYQHNDYGLPAWRWAAGAWVANVGQSANDQFSSVQNAP